jgi:hypothetical protein
MRHDTETLLWMGPSALLLIIVYAMRTAGNAMPLESARVWLSDFLAFTGDWLIWLLTRAGEIKLLPDMPESIAQWAVGALVVVMILASALSAVVHEGDRRQRGNKPEGIA